MSIDGFRVVHELRPRFRDSDAMGHVNNAVYVTYLEVGRQTYWRELNDTSDYRRVPFILAHVTVDFRAEALIREDLLIGCSCERIGGKSFQFRYEIREKTTGRLCVEATTVQVCYDYELKQSIPVPDDLRQAIETLEGRKLTAVKP